MRKPVCVEGVTDTLTFVRRAKTSWVESRDPSNIMHSYFCIYRFTGGCVAEVLATCLCTVVGSAVEHEVAYLRCLPISTPTVLILFLLETTNSNQSTYLVKSVSKLQEDWLCTSCWARHWLKVKWQVFAWWDELFPTIYRLNHASWKGITDNSENKIVAPWWLWWNIGLSVGEGQDGGPYLQGN